MLAAALLPSCGSGPTEPAPEAAEDLVAAITRFVDVQHGDDEAYRVPPSAAREDLSAAALALGSGDRADAAALAGRHDYAVVDAPDGSVLLRPERLPDARGWGLVAVRVDGVDLVVEVPHPRSDLDTDDLGTRLALATRARWLVVAGARRDLADGAADPSHREDSLLHAVHVALAEQGVPAVQVHGFADRSLPGADVVVSPGSARPGPLLDAVAEGVERIELRACLAEERRCGRLEGRTNEQGRASQRSDAAFVHLEVARSVRRDRDARAALARSVAAALARLPG